MTAEAGTPPPLFLHPVAPQRHGAGIGEELTLRAGLDAAWDAVLAVYLAGHAEWPEPFTARTP